MQQNRNNLLTNLPTSLALFPWSPNAAWWKETWQDCEFGTWHYIFCFPLISLATLLNLLDNVSSSSTPPVNCRVTCLLNESFTYIFVSPFLEIRLRYLSKVKSSVSGRDSKPGLFVFQSHVFSLKWQQILGWSCMGWDWSQKRLAGWMIEVEEDTMWDQGRWRNQTGFKTGFINRQRKLGRERVWVVGWSRSGKKLSLGLTAFATSLPSR